MLCRVESRILECGWMETPKRRRIGAIDSVLLHRIGARKGQFALCGYPNHAPQHHIGDNAIEIANWFRGHPEVLGTPLMPYHFIIMRDGTTEQALWLNVLAPHARAWNVRAIGVALIGDFRYEPPTSVQLSAAAALCTRLIDVLNRPLGIFGHTMFNPSPGSASVTPGKQCPGVYFTSAMQDIKATVKRCAIIHRGDA